MKNRSVPAWDIHRTGISCLIESNVSGLNFSIFATKYLLVRFLWYIVSILLLCWAANVTHRRLVSPCTVELEFFCLSFPQSQNRVSLANYDWLQAICDDNPQSEPVKISRYPISQAAQHSATLTLCFSVFTSPLITLFVRLIAFSHHIVVDRSIVARQ